MPPQYNVYAIVFKGDDTDEIAVLKIFKHGIEETLRQCRHLIGKIEENELGDYSIVKRQDSTVRFVAQWLNEPGDDYPSYFDLERANFTCAKLGDPSVLSVEGMPKICHPNNKPAVAGFQLNFIPGGFIFTVHVHHFAVDMTGTASIVEQIAQHCCSISVGTPRPIWDEAFMDRSRFTVPHIPANDQIDAVPKPKRHPDWLPCSWLLFHLLPYKSAELKQIATPSKDSWISTYDAVVAVLWRIIARNRAKIYKPDLSSHAIFGEPIDMRARCTPKVSTRYQGNMLAAGLSQHQREPLILAEVVSEAPLSRIAAFIRAITGNVQQTALDETVARVAPLRDKTNLDMPLDSLPPMSFTTTDWRNSRLCDNDFSVGQPMAYRNLSSSVVENMIVLYPPHKGETGAPQGTEVLLPFETHALDMLINDPDILEYFEFRGVEVAG